MSVAYDDGCLVLGPLPQPNIIIPGNINKHLKPCQQNVLRFLYVHYFKQDGAILSDKNHLHDVLPVAVFISSLARIEGNQKFLIVINEEKKIRHNLWLHYFNCIGVDRAHIKYDSQECVQTKPCIYIVNINTFDDNLLFFKKIKWTLIVYDNFAEKSSLTNMMKDLTSQCRFIISRESIFLSKKYFWSLFKFIGKCSVLGKTWQEFDDSGYKYYFNKADCTSDGKMSKINIYKTLEAMRIRFEYVSRSVECSVQDGHSTQPWS